MATVIGDLGESSANRRETEGRNERNASSAGIVDGGGGESGTAVGQRADDEKENWERIGRVRKLRTLWKKR
jgi:hypothetical protein